MGVRGRHDIRTGSVDPGVNGESCAVDRMLPFHDLAAVVYQNQIGDANLSKVHAERIDPEMIEVLGVAGGDVPRDAFIESEAREQAEGAGEALLAVLALLCDSGKCWRSGDVERVLRGHGHGCLLRLPHKYSAGAGCPQRGREAVRSLCESTLAVAPPRQDRPNNAAVKRCSREPCFRPVGARSCSHSYPRLAPWATFRRRLAAEI